MAKRDNTPATEIADETPDAPAGVPAPTTVKIGDKLVAISALPGQSLAALIQRGINHVMNSEAASRVLSLQRKAGDIKSDDKAGLEAWRVENPDLVKSIESDVDAYFVAKILEGRLGIPEASSGNGFVKAVREFAWREVAAKLEAAAPGIVPRKISDPILLKAGPVSRDELIDKWLADESRKVRIEAAVTALRTEAAAKAKAAKAAPASAPVDLGDILGG